ncbi:MAG: hypothetical protein KC496_19545, partial [Anaerolineae bacterium]|nr:hypothetical protein [Anaerolineae bacterium]
RTIDFHAGDVSQIDFKVTLLAKDDIHERVFHQFQLQTADEANVGQIVLDDYIVASRGQRLHYSFEFDPSMLLPGRYRLAYSLPTDGGAQLDAIMNLLYITIHPRKDEDKSTLGKPLHERMNGSQRGALLLSIGMHSAEAITNESLG